MRIGVIGVNHKSAEVGLREQFAKACQRRFGLNRSVHPGLSYVLLTTCNRTEVYFSSPDLPLTHTYILGILRSDIDETCEHKVYSYFGADCFFHLARVTAGMDSAILGETEIQGQVKQAYESSAKDQRLCRELHFLFQKSLKIGKDMRASLALHRDMSALEEAILSAAFYVLGDLKERNVLFVGVSDINYKIFCRFKHRGFQNITFCNRSDHRARALADEENIQWIRWEELSNWPAYDLAIFGTKSPDYLITSQGDRGSLDKRASSKLLIDLCVPRNIHPMIAQQTPYTLLNIDQLHRMISRKQKLGAAEHARVELQDIAIAVTRQLKIFNDKEGFRTAPLLSAAS